MLDSSSPPSWLRAASLRVVDASQEYHGLAAMRGVRTNAGTPRVPEWSQAWSDIVHSQRTLQGLREAGVTALVIHFDDGFGLPAQAREIEHSAEFAALCHEAGLRVFAHVEAGALCYETLLAQHPGLAAWAQRDAQGQLIPAADGLPAWRPCYLSDGFLRLLGDSLAAACERVRADGVYLANVGPHECHCQRCQHAFRRLLGSRHPEPARTLGLPSVEHVRLPERLSPADPLVAEGAYFRIYALRSALAEARIRLRSVSAHMALWAAPRLEPGALSRGTVLWELSAPVDILTYYEDSAEAAEPPLHAFLAGNATRTTICVRPREPEPARPRTNAAAALAYGGHAILWHGALRGGEIPETAQPAFLNDPSSHESWRHCIDFAAHHAHYFHGAKSIAEVALVFSMADVGATTEESEERHEAERALLSAGLPFDLLPIETAAAGRHRVLVVAGQRRVADDEAATLGGLSRAGRSLVLVGEAGALDPWGRRRRQSAFAPLLSLQHVRRTASGDLGAVVNELLGPHPILRVLGATGQPGQVAAHPFRLPTGQATIHVLNTGDRPLEGLRLQLRADLAPSRHVAWHGPEVSDRMLGCAADGESIVTALPTLRSYALIVAS